MNGLNGSNSGNVISGHIGSVLRLFSSEVQREVREAEHANQETPRNDSNTNVSFVNSTEDAEEVREARRRARPSIINSVSNLQMTCPSPDEIVIKERGRRSLPVKWSPIPFESPQKTPSRALSLRSPKRSLIALRSSPRKRLQMNDTLSSDLIQSRKALLSCSPLARRSVGSIPSPISKSTEKEVSELSKDQLIVVVNSILEKHPGIKEEIGTILEKRERIPVEDGNTSHIPESP